MSARPLFSLITLFILLRISSTAQIGHYCPLGTCDIVNPVYVNVYWDSSWDTDVAAVGGDFTIARIDALTNALVHSQYFTGLAQYDVTTVAINKSFVETAFGAVPANLDLAYNQLGNLGKWIMTEHPELDPGRTILNILIPPQVIPKDSLSSAFCVKFNGEHGMYGAPVEMCFLPTWHNCNGNVSALLATMSHEMVEATTDPVPASATGFKGLADGEIGDDCEDVARHIPFLFGSIQQYLSDSLYTKGSTGVNACIVGFDTTLVPIFSSPAGSICGSGPAMTITLNGVFGPTPFDLPAGGNKTLYLQAKVFRPDGSLVFNAGNIEGFPQPDNILFGAVYWNRPGGSDTDRILIAGFVPAIPNTPVPAISPGDSVLLTVWSQASGQPATTTLVIPSTASLSLADVLQRNPPLPAGSVDADSTASIEGSIYTGSCAFAGAQVNFSSSDPSDQFFSNPATTQGNGFFSAPYHPVNAGAKTITARFSDANNHVVSSASIPVTVYPTINILKQDNGTPAGGQTVTVMGTGFAASTTLVFNGSTINRTILSPESMSFVTPPSPFGGDGAGNVSVSASVGAQGSNQVAYSYIVPDSPRIDFISETCGVSTFRIDAYNADGSIDSGEQIILTAAYKAFGDGGYYRITLHAGQTLQISGTGPITATDANNHALTTTVNIPEYPDLCGLGIGVPGGLGSRFGPNIYKPVPGCTKCGPGGIDVSIWQAPGDPNSGDFFMVQGKAVQVEAKSISVAGLPAAELKALISANPIVFAQGVVAGDRIEFTGPAMRIAVGRSEAAERSGKAAASQKFKSEAALSFAIPAGVQGRGNYKILHLVQSKGGAAWAEVPVGGVEEGGSVKAKIAESGVYALGVVVRGGRNKER